MRYMHTQRAPIWLLLLIISAAVFTGAWLLRNDQVIAAILCGGGVAMLFLSLCFQTLTVADEGEALAVRFGPLPIFRKRIRYESISDVEPTSIALIDGWGIHYIPGRGWTWNIWGWSCVRLTVNGRSMRIGTDDPENLAAMIQAKIRSL